ncbi:hypothetical protein Hbal_1828 [Hirschia baltica ATCC 49814]|uniref:Uncharacterized protein n=1 Tax=Hirschia baltica (strain ATCC 49814 / DSM 5838 / IFAM 1418) TaxID=582402 RepID=C6XK69_HIRBI|nr:hypothetical protein Hbal_1828 [Hirschia baltica ATCC 49814]
MFPSVVDDGVTHALGGAVLLCRQRSGGLIYEIYTSRYTLKREVSE